MSKNTKLFFKFILNISLLCLIHSCASSEPYEIKSPCASINSDNPWIRVPCQKRPINVNWEIS